MDVTCPRCQTVNPATAQFCNSCGSPLAQAPPNPGQQQSAPPNPQSPMPPHGAPPNPGQQPWTQQAPPSPGQQQQWPQQGPPQGPPPGAAPGQYPPQGYPQQGYGQYPPPQGARSDKSTLALVLAILSLIACGPLTGIPGIIIAKGEMNAIQAGQASPQNMDKAKWAFYLSIAGTALSVVCFVLYILMGAASFMGGGYY